MSKDHYLATKVTPILEPLLTDLYTSSPSDIPLFCLRWLKDRSISESEKAELHSLRKQLQKLSNPKNSNSSSSSSSSELEEVVIPRRASTQRVSVSAEAYGSWNKVKIFEPPEVPKSEVQLGQIVSKLGCSFVFSSLDHRQKTVVAKAMKQVEFNPGDDVIIQGQPGDSLFFVESGKLECFKMIDEAKVFLKHYSANEAFGELALLYNVPRAASIQAVEKSICWELDRETFTHIVKNAAIARRNHFESVLSRVELLSGMDNYERVQLADGLQSVNFSAGEVVIRQGDWGDLFYIVEEGNAVALKGNPEEVVFEYKTGDYFGELALLKGQPRAASVKAVSQLKCLTLDRQSFDRLLGPLQNILSKKANEYK
jgi:cAMP-dependent protein kinase regulator